jgi:hypothetical protein
LGFPAAGLGFGGVRPLPVGFVGGGVAAARRAAGAPALGTVDRRRFGVVIAASPVASVRAVGRDGFARARPGAIAAALPALVPWAISRGAGGVASRDPARRGGSMDPAAFGRVPPSAVDFAVALGVPFRVGAGGTADTDGVVALGVRGVRFAGAAVAASARCGVALAVLAAGVIGAGTRFVAARTSPAAAGAAFAATGLGSAATHAGFAAFDGAFLVDRRRSSAAARPTSPVAALVRTGSCSGGIPGGSVTGGAGSGGASRRSTVAVAAATNSAAAAMGGLGMTTWTGSGVGSCGTTAGAVAARRCARRPSHIARTRRAMSATTASRPTMNVTSTANRGFQPPV